MHLTACWCWQKTSPASIQNHLLLHELHEAVELCNLGLIALEVSYWPPPTNRKESE